MKTELKSKKTDTAPAAKPVEKTSPVRLMLMFTLAMFGLGATAYLTFGYLGVAPLSCTDTGCDVVRLWHDQTAHLPKATLPLLGLLFFLAGATLTVMLSNADAKRGRTLSALNVALAAVGMLMMIGLTLVEARVLHAYCFWCLLVAAATLGYCGLAVAEWSAWRKGPLQYGMDYEPFVKIFWIPLVAVFLIASALEPHSAYTPEVNPPHNGNLIVDATTGGGNFAGTTTTTGGGNFAGTTTTTGGTTIMTLPVLIRPGAHIKGPEKAPVTIVEFADPGCHSCAEQSPILDELVKKYPKKVRLVVRHFPLRSHPNSRLAAEAMEAAAAQGKFWEMRDLLFTNLYQQTPADLLKYGQQLGLNMNQFKLDLMSHRYSSRVEQDRKDGDQIKVNRTPTLIINNRMYDGVQRLPTLETIIKGI